MEILRDIFGEGRDLNILQMTCRGIVVSFIALLLIRISGRRSFGMHSPLDNIIVILLGAVLSRAVVGASPFVPVIVSCLVIVSLHRIFGWILLRSKTFSRLVEGNKILFYKDGQFIRKDLRRALLREDDVMQAVRKSTFTDDLRGIDKIYMERNGKITVIKKD